MEIFTSYFAKIKTIPNDIVTVSIAAKNPQFYSGLCYRKVIPKYGFFMQWKQDHDNDAYTKAFNEEVLNTLTPQDVYNELEELTGGKDCVLLCYEKSDTFCHRHLVADWLSSNLGIKVEEWK